MELLAALDLSVYFADFKPTSKIISPIEVLKRAYQFEKNTMLFFIAIRDAIGKNELLDFGV